MHSKYSVKVEKKTLSRVRIFRRNKRNEKSFEMFESLKVTLTTMFPDNNLKQQQECAFFGFTGKVFQLFSACLFLGRAKHLFDRTKVTSATGDGVGKSSGKLR